MRAKRTAIVLRSAQSDYRKIKRYVIEKFGESSWPAINDGWQLKINKLTADPNLGSSISELDSTGFSGFKKFQYKNVFVIYHASKEHLTIYMFIPSMRDFRQHLMDRLLDAH